MHFLRALIFSIALIFVALAIGFAIPVSAQSLPVFFGNEATCLSAKPGEFQHYVPLGQTRLKYWEGRRAEVTATRDELKEDLCAKERTIDPNAPAGEREDFRYVRLAAGTPVFFVNGTPVADARCGNDFTWAQTVLEPPVAPPPAPEQPTPPAVTPAPPPQPPAEPIVIRLVPPEDEKSPARECPKCLKVEISKLDKKGQVLRFSAKFNKNNIVSVSGNWVTDKGTIIGKGSDLLVSYQRLEKLFGKKPGTHTVRFVGKDADGHDVICGGEIEIRRHGRYWLFYLPGFNCLYQAAHPKKWKGWDGVEKAGCIAGGIMAGFALGEGGVVALVKTGLKSPMPVQMP